MNNIFILLGLGLACIGTAIVNLIWKFRWLLLGISVILGILHILNFFGVLPQVKLPW